MITNDLAFGLETSGKSPEEIVNEDSTDKEIVDTKVSTGIILKQLCSWWDKEYAVL